MPSLSVKSSYIDIIKNGPILEIQACGGGLCAGTDNPKSAAPPPTADPSSSIASPKNSPPSDTSSTSTSTTAKAPTPGYGSGSNSHWPALPHTDDYEARIAQKEQDSKAHPQKKSWIKEKFDLADPTEPEYYDRKFTASGDGSNYEQTSRLAMLGFPSKHDLFHSNKKDEGGGSN